MTESLAQVLMRLAACFALPPIYWIFYMSMVEVINDIQAERRGSRRYQIPNGLFHVEDAESRQPIGELIDISANGLAFVTPKENQPKPGETIEVTFGSGGPSPQHLRMLVVRTAAFDRFFSIVGCKNVLNNKAVNPGGENTDIVSSGVLRSQPTELSTT